MVLAGRLIFEGEQSRAVGADLFDGHDRLVAELLAPELAILKPGS